MARSRLGLATLWVPVALAAAALCRDTVAAGPASRPSTLPSTAPVAASIRSPSTAPSTRPGAPDPNRLRAAVLRLGSGSPRLREQATRELWSVGRAAEPALRAAAEGDDPEVAARARSILQDFRLGVTPDTPSFILEAVSQYRQGDVMQRRRALALLGGSASDGRGPLLRLYAEEQDANWRKEILTRLQGDGPGELARTALLGGEEALAGQLIAESAESGNAGAADFAAYALAHGRIDEEIARLKTPPGPRWPTSTVPRATWPPPASSPRRPIPPRRRTSRCTRGTTGRSRTSLMPAAR